MRIREPLINAYVLIHRVVLNDEREEWALVEFTDVVNMTNYGYLKLNRLSEKPYKPLYVKAGRKLTHFGRFKTDPPRVKNIGLILAG
jgi:hypothetical protein